VMRIGGRDTTQDISQRSFTLRDDATLPAIDALGPHVVKGGAKLSLQRYQEIQAAHGNPLFHYRVDSANGLDFNFLVRGELRHRRPADRHRQHPGRPLRAGRLAAVSSGSPSTRACAGTWRTSPLEQPTTPRRPSVRAAAMQLQQDITAFNGAGLFQAGQYLTDGTQRPPFLAPSSRAWAWRSTCWATGARRCSAAPAATTTAPCTTPWPTSRTACSTRSAPSGSRGRHAARRAAHPPVAEQLPEQGRAWTG